MVVLGLALAVLWTRLTASSPRRGLLAFITDRADWLLSEMPAAGYVQQVPWDQLPSYIEPADRVADLLVKLAEQLQWSDSKLAAITAQHNKHTSAFLKQKVESAPRSAAQKQKADSAAKKDE